MTSRPAPAGRGGPARSAVGGVSTSAHVFGRKRSCISDAPSTTLRVVPLSPLHGERMKQTNSFSRRVSVRVIACTRKKIPSNKARGVERRQAHSIHWPCLRGTAARLALTGRARLSALHRGSCRSDRTLQTQPRPRFTRSRGAGITAPSTALKRSTSHAGHNAGRVDARTARERGYKPRPQEPHSPHQSAVTGRRPSMSEIRECNRNGDKCQWKCDAPSWGDYADLAASGSAWNLLRGDQFSVEGFLPWLIQSTFLRSACSWPPPPLQLRGSV